MSTAKSYYIQSVPLRPEQIKTISRYLLDSPVEVKTKCYHPLQSVLKFGIHPDEGVQADGADDRAAEVHSLSSRATITEFQAVLQFTPLLLSLFSDTEAIEEQLACLRLLVALSSHRETHPDLIRSLPSYCSLLQTQPLGSRQVRLVIRLLFKLSENSTLLETLLNCRADRWLMSMLHPSSPRETLLHCLGLLSNLSHREPQGGATSQQYNEASMYTLLYSQPTPLPQALRPLTQHSDPRVRASAGHMLSRLPMPGSPPRRSRASPPAWHPRRVLHTAPIAPRRLWPDSNCRSGLQGMRLSSFSETGMRDP